jgi:hypothetical protein
MDRMSAAQQQPTAVEHVERIEWMLRQAVRLTGRERIFLRQMLHTPQPTAKQREWLDAIEKRLA